jgi:DNA-binding winged helix-turn-helix (wHTH) protein
VTIRFGKVQIDSARRQLWRQSREIHLTAKAFDLLMLLLEQRPNLVTKSQIQERLWPDTFVSEANLPSLVAEIREAIGDNARRPTCIRTVHGFGYAFAADVELVELKREKHAVGARYWLICDERRIDLAQGENILGREGLDMIAIESSTVSRRHAKIVVAKDAATIEDLGSKNGTIVCEERIQIGRRLIDGDRIRLGSVLMTFRCSPAAGTTETQQPSATISPNRDG